MGGALRESDPDLYGRHVDEAEAASGLPIRELSLDGPLEALTRTDAAQPAIFALSLALTELARDLGLRPSATAGHSVGEYGALVAAGALAATDGMRLVAERGRLMAAAQDRRPGKMAAVVGLELEAIKRLCDQASAAGTVAPANLNGARQVVVSGDPAAVDRLAELATEAGVSRVLDLNVGAAFHSPLMEPVERQLGERIGRVALGDPEVPVATNASGELVASADQLRRDLVAQVASPVRWVECVQSIAANGCTTCLELGTGRVLAGLVRRIAPEMEVVPIESREQLERYASRAPEDRGR
jgi:[acyl-carrier-protein] S-malonyltransferase